MLDTLDLEQVSAEVLKELEFAKRPVLVFGYGLKLAGACELAKEITHLLNIPVCPTWGAIDVFPGCVGSFGTHGVRAANFAIQNADYILSVGSRLDTKATGSPASSFAPKAKLVMVDIDPYELDKMGKVGRLPWRAIRADAKEFLNMLWFWMRTKSSHDMNAGTFNNPHWDAWRLKVEAWKGSYPPGMAVGGIDPYAVVRELGSHLTPDDVIVSDTGCSLGWMMQGYPFKGEKFVHAFNNTPMGYGLPASIGAAYATGRRVALITGDGGLSVNVTELATIERHSLPIKIVLFNNRGHAMCRQTQRQWLNGEYPSTSYDGGLATPNFSRVAMAYGIQPCHSIKAMLERPGPAFYEVQIDEDTGIAPQSKFGHKLEDQEPLLPAEELARIMA